MCVVHSAHRGTVCVQDLTFLSLLRLSENCIGAVKSLNFNPPGMSDPSRVPGNNRDFAESLIKIKLERFFIFKRAHGAISDTDDKWRLLPGTLQVEVEYFSF